MIADTSILARLRAYGSEQALARYIALREVANNFHFLELARPGPAPGEGLIHWIQFDKKRPAFEKAVRSDLR